MVLEVSELVTISNNTIIEQYDECHFEKSLNSSILLFHQVHG